MTMIQAMLVLSGVALPSMALVVAYMVDEIPYTDWFSLLWRY
jgi:hypothetical protein